MSKIEHAIVIGTGFGGAVAACRLSQAGFAPLVLERGRRYGKNDFPAQPDKDGIFPDLRRWTWQNEQGLWDIEDLDEVICVQSAGYGGGSLIYANVHLRPPPDVFEKDNRWPDCYREPGFLDEYFDLAASMLGAAPISDGTGDRLKNGVPAKAQRLVDLGGQRKDGGAIFYPPLAINSGGAKDQKNRFGKEQSPCTSCGACVTGCPEGAKNTLDLNYLAEAENRGARVRTECEVIGLKKLADGHWGVEFVDHVKATKERAVAKFVFVCAGAVHSTRLLADWQASLPLEKRDPRLIANLGLGYFPNADAFGMVFDTKEKLYPAWGPTITTTSVHTPTPSPGRPDPWFLIQDGGYAATLDRLLGVFQAPIWGRRNRYPQEPFKSARSRPLDDKLRPRVAPSPDVEFLRSPVDGVLDALAQTMPTLAGNLPALAQATPEQLRGKLLGLLQEVGKPLLPRVVARTVHHAVERKLRGCFVTSWIPEKSRRFRFLTRLGKYVALLALGDSAALADDAVHALYEGGGLSRKEVAARFLGYSSDGAENRMMLLAMGRDEAPGRLHYDKKAGRMYADLDLYRVAPLYMDEELAMRDIARELGGELRVNPAWSFLGKPVTVHSQGGCRMSKDPKDGVTTPDGMVHEHEGLYVLDGSSLCRSVGTNPSPTITAIAERNIDVFLKKNAEAVTGASWPAAPYVRDRDEAHTWRKRADQRAWKITPPTPAVDSTPQSKPYGLAFNESMQGFCAAPGNGAPGFDDDVYRELENQGRPDHPVKVDLVASIRNLPKFIEDLTHSLALTGTISLALPGAAKPGVQTYRVAGTMELMVSDPEGEAGVPQPVRYREKGYGLDRNDPFQNGAIKAQEFIARNEYTTTIVAHPSVDYRTKVQTFLDTTPAGLEAPHLTSVAKAEPLPRTEERFMVYALSFRDGAGKPWCLKGYKRLRDVADVDAWRDTTWLFTQLIDEATGDTLAAGVLHVTMPGFIKQLSTVRVFTKKPDEPLDTTLDPALVSWHITTFATFFFGNLQRIYWPDLGTVLGAVMRLPVQKPSRPEPKQQHPLPCPPACPPAGSPAGPIEEDA